MMSDPFDYESTLAEIESENPVVVTWSGSTFPCSLGSRNEGKTADFGGYGLDADAQLVLRKSVFGPSGPYPVAHETLEVNSRTLRIQSVEHDPAGIFLVVNCVDNTRGV